MIKIQNLHAGVDGASILKGINLEIPAGEVHAMMGPNGSGKSTLAQVIAGNERFDVTEGEVLFNGEDIIGLSPEERAAKGIFLGFQYPVEIPGVSNSYFLRTALNAQRKLRGEPELDAMEFLTILKAKAQAMEMDPKFLNRSVNEGFSGGEKKKNEILQMSILEPKFAVLDETDSGLDIDALKVVAAGVNRNRAPDRAILVITHYQRLLDHIVPDRVHILSGGTIVKSGDRTLALELEKHGYAWVDGHVGASQ
jgi:Fe-S cluster assembly ATP-binding protein